MTICKNCKHYQEPLSFFEIKDKQTKLTRNVSINNPMNLSFPEFDSSYEEIIFSEETKKCCMLNKVTGEDDEVDEDFTGNKYFNCGGYEE